jgi:translation initiation factor IF-2
MVKTKIQVLTYIRNPIVTILGHVDHGKTTLLDIIRKTNIANKEFGGITQHVGAYQVIIPQKTINKKITFIDTPGHLAFAKMRSRGAQVADIAILVVAANDGVMPQTVESINHIKAAKIPCIIAINKIDLPDTTPDKIKKQLDKLDLKLEEYGGDIPVVPLSAKTGEGIPKLLDMILLVAELNEIKEENPGKLKAVVIESELSKNRGAFATIVLRSGNLKIGDEIVCDNQEFKLRALIDCLGNNLKEVKAGDPVSILGWKTVPMVGSIVYKKGETEIKLRPNITITEEKTPLSLEVKHENLPAEQDKIKLIIKSDTTGTLEAILGALESNQSILIIHSGVGIINETDIFLAKTTKALVVSFHQKTPDQVLKLAESEKVLIKNYNIIYELMTEIDEVIEAIRLGNLVTVLGEAKVLALFKYNDLTVAGIKVVNKRIARGDQVKIVRGEVEIGRAKIKSLRHGKEDITKAELGTEAGVILSQNIDLLTGDSIISIG